MKAVKLLAATHIHALPGVHSVSDAECARLCACGVAVPVDEVKVAAKEAAEPVKTPDETKKKTRKKAEK